MKTKIVTIIQDSPITGVVYGEKEIEITEEKVLSSYDEAKRYSIARRGIRYNLIARQRTHHK